MIYGASSASRQLLLSPVRVSSLDHQISRSISSRKGPVSKHLRSAPVVLHSTVKSSRLYSSVAGANASASGDRDRARFRPMSVPVRGLPSAVPSRAYTMSTTTATVASMSTTTDGARKAATEVPPGFDAVHLLESFPAGSQSKVGLSDHTAVEAKNDVSLFSPVNSLCNNIIPWHVRTFQLRPRQHMFFVMKSYWTSLDYTLSLFLLFLRCSAIPVVAVSIASRVDEHRTPVPSPKRR